MRGPDNFFIRNAMSDDEELIKFAESFPINNIPGFFNIMTLDSKYVVINDAAVKLTGYKSVDQLAFDSYEDMPCKASESAEIFKAEDRIVIASKQPRRVFSYQCFSDDSWSALLGEKMPLLDKNGKVIGTTAHFTNITDANLIDLGRFLTHKDKKYYPKLSLKQFSYTLLPSKNNQLLLSPRQAECLFLILRGYPLSLAAKILKISLRTVQDHVEELKIKFAVNNKQQLIETAINQGFINLVPESLFGKDFSQL